MTTSRSFDLFDAQEPLGSVVIPAHDEAAVIGRCLDALFAGFAPGELDVVVVCNGCVDDTAGVVRSSGHPVRVVERARASKAAALRAGDAASEVFPRLYLDADVVLPATAARAVLKRLRAGAVAARPPIRYECEGASAPVRSYYRARSRIPSLLHALWGAGVYGFSAEGRARFAAFPDVIADDLWVDRHFSPSEVEIVDSAPVVIRVPRRSRDLLRVLRRSVTGKAEPGPPPDLDSARTETLGSTLRGLGNLAATNPSAAVDAAAYASFAMGARVTLALAPLLDGFADPDHWERDQSSRTA